MALHGENAPLAALPRPRIPVSLPFVGLMLAWTVASFLGGWLLTTKPTESEGQVVRVEVVVPVGMELRSVPPTARR